MSPLPAVKEGSETSSPEMGPAEPKSKGRIHVLVVCGATRADKDGFIFGDFLGYCTAFQKTGVDYTFLSCFPLEKHFVFLKNKHGIDDIKFGRAGPEGSPLAIYTRRQFTLRQSFFEQIGQDVLKDEVLRWLDKKSAEVRESDVVNVVLEGHGVRKGGPVVLGSRHLFPHELVSCLSRFRPGVQVNMIVGSCFSGHFVNAIKFSGQTNRYVASAAGESTSALSDTRAISGRLRNCRYSQAVVQSLARLKLPTDTSAPGLTLNDHEEFMTDQLKRTITPARRPHDIRSYVSEPDLLDMAIQDLIFRDAIDVFYNPRVSARRRRMEMPSLDTGLLSYFRGTGRDNPPTDPKALPLVKSVLDFEISFVDYELPTPPDIGVVDIYTWTVRDESDYVYVLEELYWRGRQQSAVFDQYCLLVMRGLLDPQAIHLPMAITQSSPSVSALVFLLSCFDGFCLPPAFPDLEDRESFEPAIVWLAIAIIRGTEDPQALLATIVATKWFGEIDEELFSEYERFCHPKEVVHNPTELQAGEDEPTYFGFWLPHGITGDSDLEVATGIRKSVQRFNRMEKAFKSFLRVPDDILLLEEDQAQYYDTYPNRLPQTFNANCQGGNGS